MGSIAWKKILVLTGLTLNLAMLSGCGRLLEIQIGSGSGAEKEKREDDIVGRYEMTQKDYDTTLSGAKEIDLGTLKEGAGDGYTYDDGEVIISGEGKYLIKGKMNHGSLRVNAFEDEVIHLLFDNVEIKSDRGAALYVEKAAKVILTAMEGTENILSDGAQYRETGKACVFSNSDLTVNGNGALAVYGYYSDGVRSRDQIKIVDTSLYVKTGGDGIRGNDGVIIADSMVEVECEGTGILSDSEKDMVVVHGGDCKIIAGKNAIAANRYVSVRESRMDLYSIWEAVKCDGVRELDEEMLQ